MRTCRTGLEARTEYTGSMRARTKRLYAVGVAAVLLASAAVLAFFALRQHADLFYTPELLVERGYPAQGQQVRIGGFVALDSVAYGEGAEMVFTVEDGSEQTVQVKFVGIAPDLFREGQGVVATGKFDAKNEIFLADQLLAKHDENYQPRELRNIETRPDS